MYTVKAVVDGEEYTLHDSRVKELTLGGNPYFEVGDNINGSAEFSVFPTHPYYGKVKKLTTDIIFYRDGEPEFYGRVLYDDETFSGTKKVFVEGELAFLCDSIQRPKVYHNISVRDYVQDLIDIHNSQVEERKQFVVGRVTVQDSNDSLYRYSNYENTREAFKDKLTSRLGGHLVIRHESEKRILDYLCDDDYYKENTQSIQFGKNLLDFSKNMNASDLATCIIPLGAKLDEEDQDESLEAISEQRITIADVNGGVDYVTDDNAVKEYGKIYKTVIWDDVTQPENLMKHGREYLKTVQFEKMVLEVKAIDLNLTDESFQTFQVGDKIQCVSAPNGLDKVFPLTKKKTYITSFKSNTITLGDETRNQSYTSSNRETTANIENTVKSLPSKSEILKQALKDAQDLINGNAKKGHAIHVPEEFIVADDEDYKEKAKNLWRWGLGGLAHYSQGYNGPIDGVAITMQGKLNGKMIEAKSIMAESLDAGYRESVEKSISDAESNAKKAVMKEVESSLKVLSNQITMNVASTKELVLRKNYITGGEQETLSKDAFTVTGDVATVTEEEFLNLNCLKVEWNDTGSIVIEQNVGELPKGTYKISVETAYPESDGNAKRPEYLEYGFTGDRSTAYYNEYTAEEFHSFGKKLEITAATKAVSVKIYGNKGSVAYITNIRCLREIQEFLDEIETQIKQESGRIELSVTNTLKNYSTTTEMNSAIELVNEKISSKVSKGEIASEINQTAQSVKIAASKIDFNGAVTANEYFKILEDGSMECLAGKIGGFSIDETSLYAYATGNYKMQIDSVDKKIKVSDGTVQQITHRNANRATVVIGGATTTALFGNVDCAAGAFDSLKTHSITATTASSFNSITSSANITASGKITATSHVETDGHFYSTGTGTDLADLSVRGSKKRVLETTNYGKQAFYCYETATPYFGDIGEAEIASDGLCLIDIDDIFQESTNVEITYYVFLQKESDGECWIEERTPTYFIVCGTPGLKFCYEVKAKQSEYEHMRFADSSETAYDQAVEELDYDYETEAETIEVEEPDYETELLNDMVTIINQMEAVA